VNHAPRRIGTLDANLREHDSRLRHQALTDGLADRTRFHDETAAALSSGSRPATTCSVAAGMHLVGVADRPKTTGRSGDAAVRRRGGDAARDGAGGSAVGDLGRIDGLDARRVRGRPGGSVADAEFARSSWSAA
jgi:hypothetical protein